jgi:hypothetical protein
VFSSRILAPPDRRSVLARVSRTTRYRRADLRAVVDGHRARGRDATTLTGLIVQIDQLRRSLEALAARVRRHEEQLRRLECATNWSPGRSRSGRGRRRLQVSARQSTA